MAIKGKRKPRARSGRVVTAGPRPAYVPPKVPMFQRAGARFLVALVLEAAIFSLVVGFGEQSEGDRHRARIGEFAALIEASLLQAGPAIQPLPAGALVLPQLGTKLTELQGEDPPNAADVMAEVEVWSAALTEAADGVSTVEVPEEGLEPEQRLALTEARNLMDRGLRMYVGLAEQVRVAAQIEGKPQQELITSIQNQLPVAAATFDAGYGKLQDQRRRVGLSTTAGVPGGGFPPGGIVPGGAPGFEPPIVPGEPVEVAPGGGGGGGGGKGGGGKGGGGGGG